jgi:hypothetical protein
VHQAAHILANEEEQRMEEVRRSYRKLLSRMFSERESLGELAAAINQFLKVTKSYWKGLCSAATRWPTYLAPTTIWSSSLVRCVTTRASGRRGASPAVVVRGSVRVIAAVATLPGGFDASQIRPADLSEWRTLRASLECRRETRRAQLRFRRDPEEYLAKLEEQLLKQTLPS